MLADIYLTLAPNHTSYYEDVVELCNEITNLGYDLATCKYEDNFDATINNGPESLFEVQYSGSTEYDFWGTDGQSSWLSTFMGQFGLCCRQLRLESAYGGICEPV